MSYDGHGAVRRTVRRDGTVIALQCAAPRCHWYVLTGGPLHREFLRHRVMRRLGLGEPLGGTALVRARLPVRAGQGQVRRMLSARTATLSDMSPGPRAGTATLKAVPRCSTRRWKMPTRRSTSWAGCQTPIPRSLLSCRRVRCRALPTLKSPERADCGLPVICLGHRHPIRRPSTRCRWWPLSRDYGRPGRTGTITFRRGPRTSPLHCLPRLLRRLAQT
jgi:hypothetical protein